MSDHAHAHRLTDHDAPPARAGAPHRWFVVASGVRRRLVGTELVVTPASTVHAKRMGTTRTACGVDASSWHKLWDVRFTGAERDVCRTCALAVNDAEQVRRSGR